jgi:hypothetical protein
VSSILVTLEKHEDVQTPPDNNGRGKVLVKHASGTHLLLQDYPLGAVADVAAVEPRAVDELVQVAGDVLRSGTGRCEYRYVDMAMTLWTEPEQLLILRGCP